MQRITRDVVLLGEFRRIFRSIANDLELSELVIDSLDEFAAGAGGNPLPKGPVRE